MDSGTKEKIEQVIASIAQRRGFKRLRTVAEIEELIEVWNKHRTYTDTSRLMGISLDTIIHRIKKLSSAGIKMKKPRYVYKKPLINKMFAMQETGVTAGEIAKRFGISWATAAKYLGTRPRLGFMRLKAKQLNIFQANTAHLMDLKRAGHSSRKTELKIKRHRELKW